MQILLSILVVLHQINYAYAVIKLERKESENARGDQNDQQRPSMVNDSGTHILTTKHLVSHAKPPKVRQHRWTENNACSDGGRYLP